MTIAPASAQTIFQLYNFGDSTIDGGYFRYVPRGNNQALCNNALANGGAITPPVA
jgi:hypothetical protein